MFPSQYSDMDSFLSNLCYEYIGIQIMFGRINGKQEQIILYLYEFKNTPERGVGPDPRLTLEGIRDGTQISLLDAESQIKKLIDKAVVRSLRIGDRLFHYLTAKGYLHVEKVQKKTVSAGLDSSGPLLKFEKSELKDVQNR